MLQKQSRLWNVIYGVILLQIIPIKLLGKELPSDIRVPVVVVNAGRGVESAEIEKIIGAFASPVMRGKKIREQLGLLKSVEEGFKMAMIQSFAVAQDLFFSGSQKKAEAKFRGIVRETKSNQLAIKASSSLRELVFKSHLYLAVISRGSSDESDIDKQLDLASTGFPGLEPLPIDFPPWVCERFKSIRLSRNSKKGEVVFDAPSNCRLVLSGREIGAGTRLKGIEAGEYAAQASCSGRLSPAQKLVITDRAVTYRPLVLAHSRVGPGLRELTLMADDKAPISSLIEDLLRLARAGGWKRLIAVVGAHHTIEVWIVDADVDGIVRRAEVPLEDVQGLQQAGKTLVRGLKEIDIGKSLEKRAWYKDGLAWSLIGTGMAALSTGLVLGQVYGTSSAEEAWSWALIAGGGGAIVTGCVLFFFPINVHNTGSSGNEAKLGVGMAAGGAF